MTYTGPAGKAAPLISSPVQNLMVADKEKIVLFVTGLIPIRREGDGWAPVPGAAAAAAENAAGDDPYGWTGFASGEALPHVVAPADDVEIARRHMRHDKKHALVVDGVVHD